MLAQGVASEDSQERQLTTFVVAVVAVGIPFAVLLTCKICRWWARNLISIRAYDMTTMRDANIDIQLSVIAAILVPTVFSIIFII